MASPDADRRLLLGVALVSGVQLAAELLFIKLGRYQFGSLSFGLIGLAMLGSALAGVLLRPLGGPERANGRALVALAPALAVAGLALRALPHRYLGSSGELWLLLGAASACLIALALVAVPVYAALEHERGRADRVYFASLVGATAGALGCFALLHVAGDDLGYTIMLAACLPCAALLCPPGRLRRAAYATSALGLALALWAMPAVDAAVHAGRVYMQSNAFSRIDVYPRPGRSLQFRTAGVNGGTTSAPSLARAPVYRGFALSALPMRLHPARVLILGSGGGRDVIHALAEGAQQVTAVEINGMIPTYMRTALPAAYDPYRDPAVELVVGEGREVSARLARAGRRYDLVFVPIATLFGSSGHVFTETYLMTREALVAYLGMLSPAGSVAVYSPDEIRPKVTRALADALRAVGVSEPAAHLIGFHARGRFSLLGRPSAPYTRAEAAALLRDDLKLEPSDIAVDLARGAHSRALVDDNPFLYNDRWSARGERSVFGWNVSFMHAAYLAGVALLLALLAVGISKAPRASRPQRASTLLAFAIMGLGYAVFQTVVIQRVGFLAGHPLLSTAVVLPATLLATAAGARASARLATKRAAVTVLLAAYILACGLVAPAALVLPGVSTAARLVLAALVSAPPFVLMGSYFPAIFERTAGRDGHALRFCWLANGVGAVVGSIVVIYGSMFVGFRAMLVVAALAYLALGSWDVAQRDVELGARADRVLALVTGVALVWSLWSLNAQATALQ